MKPRALIAVAALLPVALLATELNERVAVSATIAPGYARNDAGSTGPQPQSYVFARGKFFEGSTRDTGLESASFENLVKKLAVNLARQKFFPSTDPPSTDLLIMVHWGVSQVYDDPQKGAMIDALNSALPAYNDTIASVGFADPGTVNQASDALEWAQENVSRDMARNANLLGYAREFKYSGPAGGINTETQRTLRAELSEERYFVVLMAYDYQALKKEKKSKVLWITRLSVRTPGNNFAEAFAVLGEAGSHVFGRQLDHLVHLEANLREGRVSLGELKILGLADEPLSGKKAP